MAFECGLANQERHDQTPYAVYQLKAGAGAGELQYQVASPGWHTISVPSFFQAANRSVRLTAVHSGTSVKIYRDGVLVSNTTDFAKLDYDDAQEMVVGARPPNGEVWLGDIDNLTIRAGAFPPSSLPPPAPPPAPAAGLVPSELAVLRTLYEALGGKHWRYAPGTDVYHDTDGSPCAPRPPRQGSEALGTRGACTCGSCKGSGRPWLVGDPCDSWFGVMCDEAGQHVTGLFPNPHGSGNPLLGQLPAAIGQLPHLEHLYTSNDETQSYLSGSFPPELGNLAALKCMYFSHNIISGTIPRTFERLTKLQVFLMRHNHLSGPLIDFAPLTQLKNVYAQPAL